MEYLRLTRLKLNKIRMIEPAAPIVRYEHAAPGDLLHLDIKKLARIVKAGHRITGDPKDETRGAGWEVLYVAVDDHSRMAFTARYPNEKAVSSIDFLRQATDYFQRFGIHTRAGADRQWTLLLSPPVRRSLSSSGNPPSPNPALPPPDQRQGRALHPDRPSENGPMQDDTRTQPRGWNISSPGHTSTTGTGHMPASTRCRPSVAQASMETTS